MKTYHIKYKPDYKGVNIVRAIKMTETSDNYVFSSQTENVAVISKDSVVSIELVAGDDQKPSC